jgi:signal transduction histidine kinase/Tfp pilus assembly protein PilF
VYDKTFYFLKRRTVVLTMAMVLFSVFAFSQQSKIDSLKSIVNSVAGVDKFDPLIALLRQVAASDDKQALELAREAHDIALEFSDSAKIVMSSRIMGQLLNRIARPKEAEEVLLKAAPIAKRINERDEYKVILNNLAGAYTIQAKYDKALEVNFQALVLREQDKDLAQISISLNNIGVVYFKLRNYEKALEFYQRSLELKKSASDHYDLDRLLINIGLCYNQMKDFNNSERYFRDAFSECGNDCNKQIVMEGEFGLGVAGFGLLDFENAKKHFNESLSLAKEISNDRFQAENLVYLGKIFISSADKAPASQMLLNAETIAIKFGYNELLIDVYRQLSALYSQTKDFEKATTYQSKYILFKDSIYHVDLIENIAKIQTNFAERENIATIALKDETIARQREFNILIAITAILAGALIFVLYRSIKVKRKVNADLSDAKAIIEDQNKQLRTSNVSLNQELKERNVDLQKANDSLQRVNEELDNFIYKTSHDIRGPLASLKGMCNVALMDVKDPLALNYLHKLDITAEKLNTILTRLLIVNQINASGLGSERIDFESIVEDILMLEKKKGLPKRLTITKSICPKTVFHSDGQFVRIILENLIDNAIKFYNDSERIEPFVNINIAGNVDHVSINVVDNGIGISEVHPDKIFQMFSRASERSETGGIGLYITKTATEKLGGSVHLKTTPEGYTEFYVKLPYKHNRVIEEPVPGDKMQSA